MCYFWIGFYLKTLSAQNLLKTDKSIELNLEVYAVEDHPKKALLGARMVYLLLNILLIFKINVLVEKFLLFWEWIEARLIEAKFAQISHWQWRVQSCKLFAGPCLLMGLGSLQGFGEQPLCCILVHLTLPNRLLSRGYWCSHDLTWPQMKLCLMVCANGKLNLLLNHISMAT